MDVESRTGLFEGVTSIVVKIGTQSMTRTSAAGVGLDARFIGRLATEVVALRERGVSVTIVSSGAIGAGCVELGRDTRPTDLADAQAVAAVGQRRLMTAWSNAFSRRGLGVGQVLLTRGDFDDRDRFLNIRNCVDRLHAMRCVPILNENDSVAVEELRFGDNDLLAGLMCNAIRAQALVMLTVVPGLLDDDGDRVPVVEDVLAWRSKIRAEKSTWGSGGMGSKLEAARLVTGAGEAAVVAGAAEKQVLHRVLAGDDVGTAFLPVRRHNRGKLDAKQRWIGLTVRPAGTVTVDAGAASALRADGASLLAIGITASQGRFERGDAVLIRDANGRELGRGLTNFSSEDVRLIKGRKSSEFAAILGTPGDAAVVHRNNLVMAADAGV